MKHDNVIYLDSMVWNWSRSVVCEDTIFVASCVNEVIANEIRWPSTQERRALADHILQLQGCIGFVDGTHKVIYVTLHMSEFKCERIRIIHSNNMVF